MQVVSSNNYPKSHLAFTAQNVKTGVAGYAASKLFAIGEKYPEYKEDSRIMAEFNIGVGHTEKTSTELPTMSRRNVSRYIREEVRKARRMMTR